MAAPLAPPRIAPRIAPPTAPPPTFAALELPGADAFAIDRFGADRHPRPVGEHQRVEPDAEPRAILELAAAFDFDHRPDRAGAAGIATRSPTFTSRVTFASTLSSTRAVSLDSRFSVCRPSTESADTTSSSNTRCGGSGARAGSCEVRSSLRGNAEGSLTGGAEGLAAGGRARRPRTRQRRGVVARRVCPPRAGVEALREGGGSERRALRDVTGAARVRPRPGLPLAWPCRRRALRFPARDARRSQAREGRLQPAVPGRPPVSAPCSGAPRNSRQGLRCDAANAQQDHRKSVRNM